MMQVTPVSPAQAVRPDSELAFSPILIGEIELSEVLPTFSAFDEHGTQVYCSARCLVRLHTQPLGLVDLSFENGELSPGNYLSSIWQHLGQRINEHLQEDGFPIITQLSADGLSSSQTPKCLQEREAFLQRSPFVSVVLSTRDRPERLARCLRALLAQQYPTYEVIVVDNAPTTPATAEFIQQTYSQEARIRYVREDRPGLSWGRNRGIMEARGEIIAFTDDDVVVDAHWLSELAMGFEAAENVACVTSMLLPLELQTQAQLWLEEFGGFSKGFRRRIFDRKSGGEDIPLYPFTAGRFGTGGGMAFTAAFLREEGNFDPALGNGTPSGAGEDLVAFFHVIARGYRLVYTPGSLLYHEHHRDYAKLRRQLYCYGSSVTAYLTKIILNNPLLFFRIALLIPQGLFFILSAKSAKNQKKSTSFPAELNRLERQGMLHGPFLYLKGRWKMRSLRAR
jgi:glycosyltransferase involved in cell wall biosynthesis